MDFVKRKQPDPKVYILYDPTYKILEKAKLLRLR